MDDASRRLAQLARILSDGRPYSEASASDLADHLHRIRLNRIQGFTGQLDDGAGRGVDVVDAVAMRLVLDDFASVVAHLRTVARERATALGTLAAQLRADRRLVDEQLAHREKQPAATAPSDRQPASQTPGT